jgi:RHS repeat-associated protein
MEVASGKRIQTLASIAMVSPGSRGCSLPNVDMPWGTFMSDFCLRTAVNRRSALSGVVLVLACAACGVVRAEDEVTYSADSDYLDYVNRAPGAPSGSPFAGFEDGESVSLYNGNVLIHHAASPSYALDGGGSVQLSRVFNSKRVRRDYVPHHEVCEPSGCVTIYQHRLFGRSWIGAGWTMHLGRLMPQLRSQDESWEEEGPGTFVDSQGTEFRISPFLREARPYLTGTKQGGSPYYWTVDFPNGSRYEFRFRIAAEPNEVGTVENDDRYGWYVTTITDVHGNQVNVEYWDQANPEFPEAIRRVQVKRYPETAFQTVLETELWTAAHGDSGGAEFDPDFVPAAVGTLRNLRVLGPEGSWIEYKYVYESRPFEDEFRGTTDDPVLTEVRYPQVPPAPQAVVRYEYPGPDPLGRTPNTLRVMRIYYPTGGVSEYTYDRYRAGNRVECPGVLETCPNLLNRWETGAATRTLYPHGLGLNMPKAVWKWRRAFHACEESGCGNAVVNEFSQNSPDGSWLEAEFLGDPYGGGGWEGKEKLRVHFAADGRKVRSEVSEYTSLGTVSERGETYVREALLSDFTNTYHDDDGACFASPGEPGETGTKTMETHYHQRSPHNLWKMTRIEGDYLELNTIDHLNDPIGRRLTFTNYEETLNPCRATKHVLDAFDFSFVQEGNKRIESNYTFDCNGDIDAVTAKRDIVTVSGNCERAPGIGPEYPPREKWERWGVCANAAPQDGDATHDLTWGTNGSLLAIDYTGGDPYAAGGSTRSYRVDYMWEYGRAESVTVQGLTYPSRKIDVNAAGFVTASEDPNGLRSNYQFDALGRITSIAPPGMTEWPTRAHYPSLTETRVVQSAGTETEFSATDPDQIYTDLQFDGLGRVVRSRKAMPDGRLAVQHTRFDAMGRVIFVSEWLPESYSVAPVNRDDTVEGWALWEGVAEYVPPAGCEGEACIPLPARQDGYFVWVPVKDGRPWGTVTFYGIPAASDPGNPLAAFGDALGRVRRVELADGSATDTRYCGPHNEVTVHRASAAGASPTLPAVKTRYYHDGLGRLALVDVEPFAGATGSPVGADAEYRYDVRGNLIKVNLVANLPSDPFALWVNTTIPPGQIRTFRFDGLGRLRKACNPENGCTETTAYDVWGKPLLTQDWAGGADDEDHSSAEEDLYHFKNHYDVAGRLIRVEKVAGSPGATTPSDVTRLGGVGDFNEAGDVGADGWELGTLDSSWTAFTAGATAWNRTSYSTLGCIPGPPGESGSGSGLKFGAGCSYEDDGALPHAARFLAADVTREDVLSLSYWREVRQGSDSNQDRFEVFLTLGDEGAQVTDRRVVFRLSSKQASTSRWERAADVRPGDFFNETEWGEGTAESLYVYIVFHKGDTAGAGLGRGLVVDDVSLGRRGVETLAEFDFDQTVCPGAGEACSSTEETTERFKGNLSRQRSYQDGRLVETKDLVYKGMNGRLSGTRSTIDLTGHGETHDWVTRWEYGSSGIVSHWTAPYLPGVDETRRYGLEYDRALLRGMNVHSPSLLEEFVGFDGSPIRYDLSGALIEIPFSNQARTAVAVDKMGRPVSYAVTREGEPGAYWSSGGYQFDGAGNIVGIGDQTFEYDGVGRLTQARVRNQAYTQGSGNFFVETYAFDIFGNMTEKTWAEENTAQQDPPLGAVFSHTFGPDPAANTNQIQTEGYRFDKNGNMTRFRHNDGPVAALWTAQNRMAAFYTGDPETTVSSPTERYTYDSSGYRVLRFPESGNGLRVITLRDGSGQPLAEYVDSPGSAQPRHAKDFVHGAGMLLMERWIDDSAPSATNTSPMASNGNVGLSVSAADPIETWAVDVRPEGGGASLVSGLAVDAEGKIWLPESNLTPDVTNYLRVRRDDGEAGAYSNSVTVAYDPDVNAQSANQVRAVSVSRSGTNVQVRWQLFQANGKALRLYYQRADGGGTLLLTPAGLASGTTTFSIQNQSLTVQCGYFYLTQQISGSSWSGPSPAAGLPPSGSSQDLSKNGTGDCSGGAPGPEPTAPAWIDTFHHRDHLGSLRIVTDAGGWVVPGGRHDYYPFGMEMVPTNTFTGGGSRKRFTGHERDEESGLDYMVGRYKAQSAANFLSVDPVLQVERSSGSPQEWNRLAYVANDPVRATDPSGCVIAYGPSVVKSKRNDPTFRMGFELWKATKLGQEQWRNLGKSNAVHRFEVGRVWVPRGFALDAEQVFGKTEPPLDTRAMATADKAGKLHVSETTSTVNAEYIEESSTSIGEAAKKIAAALYEEAYHALDLGAGRATTREAEAAEKKFHQDDLPSFTEFKAEVEALMPSDHPDKK